MNLKVEYPPPYQHLVWNFKKSNNDAIKRAIELVNWNSTQCNEKIVFNPMLEFLEENGLLCPHQSGFHSSDSCQSHLLAIVQDIYSNFDQSPTLEVRANFLDILKALDKVWHEGLIFKLQHTGISGNLLNLLKSFLNN